MSAPLIYLIGLGAMGRNLALNYLDHGVEVIAYDLDPKVCEEIKQSSSLQVTDSLQALLSIDPVAWQNGTGIWTVRSALEYGVPVLVLSTAMTARQSAQCPRDVARKQSGL